MIVHPREKDLVIGTHGRSIWILDDTRPLAEWAPGQGRRAYLFSIAPGTIWQYKKDTSYRGEADWIGDNPDEGVLVTYKLEAGSGDATLRIAREDGTVVREMAVPSEPGTHRVNWDLRHGLPGREDTWERFDNPKAGAHPGDARALRVARAATR